MSQARTNEIARRQSRSGRRFPLAIRRHTPTAKRPPEATTDFSAMGAVGSWSRDTSAITSPDLTTCVTAVTHVYRRVYPDSGIERG